MNLFARHVLNTTSLHYNDNIILTSLLPCCLEYFQENGIIVRLRQDQFLRQKRLLIQDYNLIHKKIMPHWMKALYYAGELHDSHCLM